jgi:hypothetical protein
MTIPGSRGNPERWNLLFDAAGRLWPRVEESLDLEAVTVTTEAADPEADALSASGELVVPYKFTPGDVIPRRVAELIAAALEEQWGIRRDDLIMGTYGFHPLPTSAESWNFSEGIFGLGHPVFWLPQDIVDVGERIWKDERYGPHAESLEQIRLWLELAVRGAADPTSGNVVDVFTRNNIDWTGDDFQEFWALGPGPARDEFVAGLTLPEPEDGAHGAARLLWAAVEAVDFVREAYPLVAHVEVEDVNDQVYRYMQLAKATTVAELMETFDKAGEAWFSSQRGVVDKRAVGDAALRVVTSIASIVREDFAVLTEMASLRTRRFAPASDADLDTRLEEAEADLAAIDATARRGIEALMAGAPGDTRPYTDLWNDLSTPMMRWHNLTLELVTHWENQGPVEEEEYLVSPPPEIAVPEGAKAELARIRSTLST